jgi:hypothetical protein
MFNWLRRLFGGKNHRRAPARPARSNVPTRPTNATKQVVAARTAAAAHAAHPNGLRSEAEARQYLEKLHGKINALAQRFAAGNINRVQFQELYAHYQNEQQTIEALLQAAPQSDEWKSAVTEGQSILIRHRHQAQALGFSIYSNDSGMPVKSIGQFGVDPALFVPMLSAYRSAAKEIFGAGLRSTQIEGGKWLSFIPGKITTTLALFNMEPSAKQLKVLDEMQNLFESANAYNLSNTVVNPEQLVCPHEFFLDHSL